MGLSSSKRPSQVLVVGLDAAGKTTMLHKMKPKEVKETIPTIGFNVEHAELKTGLDLISIDCWDVGGRSGLRPLWRYFYEGKDAVIFVVDSQDRMRLMEVKDEIRKISDENALDGLPMLIFANKQDLPMAASAAELVETLELKALRQQWQIIESSFEKKQGLTEGLQWLLSAIHGSKAMGEKAVGSQGKDDASTTASEDASPVKSP
eukprot:Skav231071  [mRNA]  locus=scaffold524:235886:236503:+ [translate_table: standard]